MNPATFTAGADPERGRPQRNGRRSLHGHAQPAGTDPDPLHPRTYRIGFAAQSRQRQLHGHPELEHRVGQRQRARHERECRGQSAFRHGPPGRGNPHHLLEHDGDSARPAASTVTSSLTIPTNVLVQGLTVSLDITYANDPDLEVFLTAPDGTSIELIKNAGAAEGPISPGRFSTTRRRRRSRTRAAPFTGRFQPLQPLSTFNGKNAAGVWTLSITDDASTADMVGMLNSWSLTVQPPATNTYTAQITVPLDDPQARRARSPSHSTRRSTFPTVSLSAGVSVQLNITDASDPDLEAYLIAPDGTKVQLFKNVGATGTKANFTNTVFSDNATTSILSGGAPFFGAFQPQQAGGIPPGARDRPRRWCDQLQRYLDPADHRRQVRRHYRHAQ